MGFLPSHLRMLIRAHRRHAFRGPVCTLGNQETWASYADLEDLFHAADYPYQKVDRVYRHTSKMFAEQPVLRDLARDFVHAKVFFQMLGIDEYVDVDAFEFDKPALIFDLNHTIPGSLADSFRLVIDGGTVEHIFDVRQVLTNIVRLLQVGGHVVHMASFEMDHGFYALSPCLFFDFYGANGFSDFTCFVLQFDYEHILTSYRERVPCFEYHYGMQVEELLDRKRRPAIFFVARKERQVGEVIVPFQGIYSRRAGLSEFPEGGQPSGAEKQRSLFDAYVPRWLHGPMGPVRPILARGRSRISQFLEKRRRVLNMERV